MNNLNEIEILLVEDNASDAELTQLALTKNHLSNNIEVVTDGEEALNFIFSQGPYSERDLNSHPKLILLDLKLPFVSGLEVLKKVKADERTKKIPIVVLTSSAEESDVSECYKLGVNSYIVKPVNFDNFIKAVSEVGLYWMLLNKLPSD